MNEHEERPKTSQKQIEANRRNAHKSTGPSEGKASRHNAVKHGMTAQTAVLPDEDPEGRDGLRESLYAEDNPVVVSELMSSSARGLLDLLDKPGDEPVRGEEWVEWSGEAIWAAGITVQREAPRREA